MPEKKKKKRKRTYRLVIVSDVPSDGTKYLKFTKARLNFLKSILTIIVLVVLSYLLLCAYERTTIVTRESNLQAKIQNAAQENEKLKKDNEELTDKVNILSETVNQKVDAEKQQEEKNMPSGFPLSGTADMEETTETITINNEEITRPIILFKAGDGVSVIASGAGTVTVADSDAVYGYQVVIDHGNGYQSIYRSGTEPKVKTGDEVARGALLFEMDAEDDDNANASKMGYQIMKDAAYIEPTQVLIING